MTWDSISAWLDWRLLSVVLLVVWLVLRSKIKAKHQRSLVARSQAEDEEEAAIDERLAERRRQLEAEKRAARRNR